jgi:hypothetical protein
VAPPDEERLPAGLLSRRSGVAGLKQPEGGGGSILFRRKGPCRGPKAARVMKPYGLLSDVEAPRPPRQTESFGAAEAAEDRIHTVGRRRRSGPLERLWTAGALLTWIRKERKLNKTATAAALL